MIDPDPDIAMSDPVVEYIALTERTDDSRSNGKPRPGTAGRRLGMLANFTPAEIGELRSYWRWLYEKSRRENERAAGQSL